MYLIWYWSKASGSGVAGRPAWHLAIMALMMAILRACALSPCLNILHYMVTVMLIE
jgi:hypothetical protein